MWEGNPKAQDLKSKDFEIKPFPLESTGDLDLLCPYL